MANTDEFVEIGLKHDLTRLGIKIPYYELDADAMCLSLGQLGYFCLSILLLYVSP